jgi:hypothetical protein
MTQQQVRRPEAARERRWPGPYWAAIALFVCVKFFWVLAPAHPMGVPRLGDDALVYLWTGASTVFSPKVATPAVRSIEHYRGLSDSPSVALDADRARVAMRTTGVSSSPLALLTGLTLLSGLSQKVAFAVIEALVALALAAGIAYGMAAYYGRAAAAGTLAVLAFALLPNQGLQYLVPSVFVLAAALGLWALALKKDRSEWMMFALALLMLLSHTIGQVYVLAALAMLAGRSLLLRSISRDTLIKCAALVMAVIAWRAANWILEARAPATSGLGGISLEMIPRNLAGLARHLVTLAKTQPLIALLLVAGLWRAMTGWRHNRDSFILVGVLAGVTVTTLAVDIPGYPGELPSRALIALTIACCAASFQWGFALLAPRPGLRKPVLAVLALAVALQVPAFVEQLYANINSRHQLYQDDLLRAEVRRLPDDATVVWVDTDLAMMAGLLEGAERLRFVPYRMLGGQEALRESIAGTKDVYVATSFPERLNGASTIGARTLSKRYYGYGFDLFRRVSLYADAPNALPAYVRVEGGGGQLEVQSGTGTRCVLEPAAHASPGWHKLAGCENALALHFEGGRQLKITGLSMNQPIDASPWPWGAAGLRIRAEPRDGGEAAELAFALPNLLGTDLAASLQRHAGTLSVISSESGVIWLRAAGPGK